MNINFNINHSCRRSEKVIHIVISGIIKRKRFHITTSEKIELKHWDTVKQKVKHTHTESYSLNNRLDFIKKTINAKYRELINSDSAITYEAIETELRNLFVIKEKEKQKKVLEVGQ